MNDKPSKKNEQKLRQYIEKSKSDNSGTGSVRERTLPDTHVRTR